MTLTCGFDRNNLATFGWMDMKFVTDINIPLRMIYDHFGDPLTFRLSPPPGQNFNLSNTLVYKTNNMPIIVVNQLSIDRLMASL